MRAICLGHVHQAKLSAGESKSGSDVAALKKELEDVKAQLAGKVTH